MPQLTPLFSNECRTAAVPPQRFARDWCRPSKCCLFAAAGGGGEAAPSAVCDDVELRFTCQTAAVTLAGLDPVFARRRQDDMPGRIPVLRLAIGQALPFADTPPAVASQTTKNPTELVA